jgi:hypothetical protein
MTDETPELDMQEQVEQTEAAVNAEQSPTASEQDIVTARERAAFETYVKSQGVPVPENFKDVGSWFDSLKNAQKAYTQSRQEIADLKKKYEKSSDNPNFKAPTEDSKPAAKEEEVIAVDKLQIPKQPEKTEEAPAEYAVTQDDWKSWTVEFATKGELSAETKEQIKQKTKLPDYVIDDYMTGQKAKLEVAYKKAADLIGGNDKLNKVFTWASKNLSQTEQDGINAALATPNWEIALLGLTTKYEKANGNTAKTNEPPATGKKVPVSATQVPATAYKTKREFQVERNNPRFMTDPKYRAAVEKRMLMTDFTKLTP